MRGPRKTIETDWVNKEQLGEGNKGIIFQIVRADTLRGS